MNKLDERCIAIGIVPQIPSVFWDYDLTPEEEVGKAIETLETYAKSKKVRYAIYQTKHGLHLILETVTWDNAQNWLYELKKLTNKQSIMSCRKQRIRISPKWLKINGQIVSPEPKRILDNTIAELRVGRKETYETYDKTNIINIPEKIYELLGEKKDVE